MSKRQTSKILSLLLTVCLVLSTIPITALAQDSSNTPAEFSGNELGDDTGSDEVIPHIAKRAMPGTPTSPVTAPLATPRTTAEGENSGYCGDPVLEDVKWVFDPATGTLTISGKGAMENYSGADPLWYQHKDTIREVIVENGITSIGDFAFNRCSSLTNISLPEGLTSIGNGTFQFCRSLTSIDIPNSVTNIDNIAFGMCTGLTSISLPEGLTHIGNHAFQNTGLTSIDIPNSVEHLRGSEFFSAEALKLLPSETV